MLILLGLMILSTVIGLYAGRKRARETKMDATILGSLFALLGLMLAFSFSLATNFFGMRREIIIDEANNIGTAILRADLYRNSDRQLFRTDFKNYIEARIDYYASKDENTVLKAQELTVQIQQQLWGRASGLSTDTGYFVASMQMIPALNKMIDITTTRFYGDYVHLPDPIIYLLILLACACAFFVGYTIAGKEKFDWVMAIGFYLLTSLIVFVIFDLDRPRRGLIRLDKINQSVVNLRKMIPEEIKINK
jgi:hypothetical protein